MTAYLLTILICVMLMAYVAMLYTEGMWSNAIRLINVVTAALLATNFFEPVAQWLDDWDHAAELRVGLPNPVGAVRGADDDLPTGDRPDLSGEGSFSRRGRPGRQRFFAIWVGWVMICFMMMTLHTAPLARNFLFGGFQPEQRMFLGLAPDRQWLGFMRKMSLGPFCRWASEEELRQKYMFDPNAEFLPKYTARRTKLQANVAANDSICEPSSP